MKKSILIILSALCLFACGGKRDSAKEETTAALQNMPGDSTRYGLACDGCTDSILVLLPFSGANPDTFDVINAFQQHRVLGRPQVGDELAVILNPEDKEEVLMVINIEEIKGEWCYQVMPTFRNLENMPQRMQRRMMERIPDSVKQKLLVPREYGLRLKRGNVAQSFGASRNRNADQMSPVEYPKLRRYGEWRLYNGQLLLGTDTSSFANNEKKAREYDTVTIQLLRHDSLVLKFKDHEQGYYRKTNNNQ
ncbi:MAG: hypothetical protein IJ190_06305 [Prevotella sp.]|nr:hypothetical protein [Prevotella sp.]